LIWKETLIGGRKAKFLYWFESCAKNSSERNLSNKQSSFKECYLDLIVPSINQRDVMTRKGRDEFLWDKPQIGWVIRRNNTVINIEKFGRSKGVLISWFY